MSTEKKRENGKLGYFKTQNLYTLTEDIILYNSVPFNEKIIYPIMAGTTNPDPNYFVRRAKPNDLQYTYVLEYVVSGKGYTEVNDKKYALRAGDFCIMNRYTLGCGYPDKNDPYKKIWITLYGTFINGLAYTYHITEPVLIVRAERAGEYMLKLLDIIEESKKIGFEQCSDRFMIELLKLFQYVESIRKSELTVRKNIDFIQIKEYIQKNIQNEYLSTEYLCTYFNISYATLYRMCLKSVDKSPQHYIEFLKLENAKEMLLSEKLTVSEISERLNFSSTGYFCKVFKKNMGCSATEWKRRELRRGRG